MTRLDIQLQRSSASISPVSHSDPSTWLRPSGQGVEVGRRLIILGPDDDLDYAAATRRVWELAGEMEAHILFVGLCKNPEQESGLRRQLITMTAMVQGGKASAEAILETGTNWVAIVKRTYQKDDLVICFAEQRVGFLQKPLSQILQSNLRIPIYIISGVFMRNPRLNWRSQVALWTGYAGIVLAFCLLQVRIVQLPRDGFQSVLLMLSIIPEFWLIWVWNNLFS